MKFFLAAVSLAAMSTAAWAAGCPRTAPKHDWNIHSDDQRVGTAFLKKNIAGKRVKYRSGGTENYVGDGSYSFKNADGTWNASEYRFYSNGVRCIGYSPEPRFDMYVVNNGKLVLINWQGARLEGSLLK